MSNVNFKLFSELPQDIDFKQNHDHWSWSRGGYGLRNEQWHIDYIHDDLSMDIYVLPDYFIYLIMTELHWKEQAIKCNIRTALGVD